MVGLNVPRQAALNGFTAAPVTTGVATAASNTIPMVADSVRGISAFPTRVSQVVNLEVLLHPANVERVNKTLKDLEEDAVRLNAQIARLKGEVIAGERANEEMERQLLQHEQKKVSDGRMALMIGIAASNAKTKKTAVAAAVEENLKDNADPITKKPSRKKKGNTTRKPLQKKKKKDKQSAEGVQTASFEDNDDDTLVPEVRDINSFDSERTITEDEADVLALVESDDGSVGSDGMDEVPLVGRVISGRVVKIAGNQKECRVRLTYEDKPLEVHDVQAKGAVLDDPDYKVLRWIIQKKSKETIWREQISAAIETSKNDEVTFFRDWVDWDAFVKKTEEGLDALDEDGGGKSKAIEKAKKPSCTYAQESPLKIKKTRCLLHNFVPEDKKEYARKGTGWCLDDIVCEGYQKQCGKEFVEFQKDSKIKGNGLVVSSKNPAFWCRDCNLVYCSECHSAMLLANEGNNGGRATRRRL